MLLVTISRGYGGLTPHGDCSSQPLLIPLLMHPWVPSPPTVRGMRSWPAFYSLLALWFTLTIRAHSQLSSSNSILNQAVQHILTLKRCTQRERGEATGARKMNSASDSKREKDRKEQHSSSSPGKSDYMYVARVVVRLLQCFRMSMSQFWTIDQRSTHSLSLSSRPVFPRTIQTSVWFVMHSSQGCIFAPERTNLLIALVAQPVRETRWRKRVESRPKHDTQRSQKGCHRTCFLEECH